MGQSRGRGAQGVRPTEQRFIRAHLLCLIVDAPQRRGASLVVGPCTGTHPAPHERNHLARKEQKGQDLHVQGRRRGAQRGLASGTASGHRHHGAARCSEAPDHADALGDTRIAQGGERKGCPHPNLARQAALGLCLLSLLWGCKGQCSLLPPRLYNPAQPDLQRHLWSCHRHRNWPRQWAKPRSLRSIH